MFSIKSAFGSLARDTYTQQAAEPGLAAWQETHQPDTHGNMKYL